MKIQAVARFPRYLSRTRNVSTCSRSAAADLFHVSIRATQFLSSWWLARTASATLPRASLCERTVCARLSCQLVCTLQ